MDTKTLIADSKARFAHNSAKQYLKEKYEAKLLVAEQGGLFTANSETIAFLNSFTQYNLVVVDTFNNPVQVIRQELLYKLQDTYIAVMEEWYAEWKELENKR
jgi:hypothetical protein